MKKYLLWLLVIVMFFAVTAGGCGGRSSNSSFVEDPGETEDVNGEPSDTEDVNVNNGETGEKQSEEEGRGVSGGNVSVRIDTAGACGAKSMTFYGKKSDGNWETLDSLTFGGSISEGKNNGGNKNFTVSNRVSQVNCV